MEQLNSRRVSVALIEVGTISPMVDLLYLIGILFPLVIIGRLALDFTPTLAATLIAAVAFGIYTLNRLEIPTYIEETRRWIEAAEYGMGQVILRPSALELGYKKIARYTWLLPKRLRRRLREIGEQLPAYRTMAAIRGIPEDKDEYLSWLASMDVMEILQQEIGNTLQHTKNII